MKDHKPRIASLRFQAMYNLQYQIYMHQNHMKKTTRYVKDSMANKEQSNRMVGLNIYMHRNNLTKVVFSNNPFHLHSEFPGITSLQSFVRVSKDGLDAVLCMVSMLAIITSVQQYFSSAVPLLTCCQIKHFFIAVCFSQP